MAWEYADMFDAEIEPSDSDGQITFWQDEPSTLKVGQMGYKRKTTKAGPRLEAEIYPVFGREAASALRDARQRRTHEKQRRLNEARAKHNLVLLVETNFTAADFHLTLTYGGEEPDIERCRKDVRNFLNRIRRLREKRGLEEVKYIYAIGFDAETRIHVHMLISGGIERDELEKIWGKGRTNCLRLQPDSNGLQGIAHYLYRQNAIARENGDMQWQKSWVPSRNLKRPKTRKKAANLSNARVRRLAADFANGAKDIMEKLYPGYSFVSCSVKFSDIVDGVYIRCVMRKWGGVMP